jgi:SPP1 family predicted phage head-tail adaptor
MTAGRLTERVLFERASETPDGAGGFTVTWATLAERWAEARPVRGRERNEAGQTITTNTFLFVVRRDCVTATIGGGDRGQWSGRTWNILSARPGLPNGDKPRAFVTIEAETQIG